MAIPNNYKSVNPHYGGSKGGNLNKFKLTGAILGIALLILGITAYNTIGFVEVKGHQAAVVENQFTLLGLLGEKGVQQHTLGPGKHFYIPFAQRIEVYNIGTDNFVMGADQYYSGKGTDFTDFGELKITCKDGPNKEQPAFFNFTLQYNIKRDNLTKLHVESGQQYKDRVIKPALVRIINDLATSQNVLDFYSGPGKVKLQQDVYNAVKSDATLAGNGINVTTFVFDHIGLDKKYESDILGRQQAIQEELRVNAEKKVEIAKAEKEKEAAQADKYKRVAAAEAERQEREEAAKAKKYEIIADAEADAEKVRKAAAADAYRKTQNAIALKKEGLAKAAVAQALKISKYDGVSGKRQAEVDIATALVEKYKNFNPKGFVTEKAFFNVFDENGSNKSPTLTIETNSAE